MGKKVEMTSFIFINVSCLYFCVIESKMASMIILHIIKKQLFLFSTNKKISNIFYSIDKNIIFYLGKIEAN